MLVRLLYASRAVDDSPKAIDTILAQARAHNTACGITGILCYGNGGFLQAIEGSRTAVNELYGHIVKDPRHKDVALVYFEEIAERRFGGWTMGQVHLTRVHASTLMRFSERAELDPYAVPGRVSLALLEELMATAAVGVRN